MGRTACLLTDRLFVLRIVPVRANHANPTNHANLTDRANPFNPLIQLPRREDRQNEPIPAALHLIPPVYFRSLSILASLVDTIGRICLELLDRLNRRNLRKK